MPTAPRRRRPGPTRRRSERYRSPAPPGRKPLRGRVRGFGFHGLLQAHRPQRLEGDQHDEHTQDQQDEIPRLHERDPPRPPPIPPLCHLARHPQQHDDDDRRDDNRRQQHRPAAPVGGFGRSEQPERDRPDQERQGQHAGEQGDGDDRLHRRSPHRCRHAHSNTTMTANPAAARTRMTSVFGFTASLGSARRPRASSPPPRRSSGRTPQRRPRSPQRPQSCSASPAPPRAPPGRGRLPRAGRVRGLGRS